MDCLQNMLPKNIWWLILSKLSLSEIFSDNILNSQLSPLVKDSEFRMWLMMLHKSNDEVYDIDIDQSFLRPQNTMTVRECRFVSQDGKPIAVAEKCGHFNCSCKNKEPIQVVWWGDGDYKSEHKEWWRQYQEQFPVTLWKPTRWGYGFDEMIGYGGVGAELHYNELSKPPVSQKKSRIVTTPIEMNSVKNKSNAFCHPEWDKHNINLINFDVSDETQKLASQLVFDNSGKPINFPEPIEVEADRTLDDKLLDHLYLLRESIF